MYTRDHIHRHAALVLIEAEWAVLQREEYSLGGRWRRWYGKRTVTQKVWAFCSVAILLFGWLMADTLNRQDKALAYEPIKWTEDGTPPPSFKDPYPQQRWNYEAFNPEKAAQGGTESTAAGPKPEEGLPQAGPKR